MDSRHALWVLVSAPLMGPVVTTQEAPCGEFQTRLEAVPHAALATRVGPIPSLWPGEPPAGCEVTFETNDSLLAGAVAPVFFADPGTEMHAAGWRLIPRLLADGPGSGIHGMQKGEVRCLIRWEQPAYIDDDGTFVQSETFSMVIQCRTGPPSGLPGPAGSAGGGLRAP